MKNMLTKKQKEVLEFIQDYINEHDYSPTLEEIAEHIGVSTVSTVHEHLQKLKDKNYIEIKDNQPRAIKPKKSNSNVKVPILGLIRAGEPIEPVEESEPYQVPKEMLSESGDHFALKVEGQSMVEEGIQDGDIVILRDQPDIENGQTAAVYIPRKNEATLKKVYKEKDKWKLQPANPNMDPFYEKNIEVRGKVINIIRNFA